MHRPVDPSPDFPALEEEVLEWWNANAVQKAALAQREGAPEFVFYEGPPFANAPPGVHSVLPRVIKDVYTRFQTMKGRYVPRKAGWDCHGLPAEVEIEKKLGFTSKRQILDYGIERFNHLCRTSVSEYITNYVRFSERIAFWLDYEDAYQTMSNEYIESVWWSLAELHGKGLLFEAHRVAPYCPRCETPLSDHELGQEGVYREVTDPGITVAFPLEGSPAVAGTSLEDASLAVWTTTPWTLIANLACAVHPDLEYALVDHDGRRLVLARPLVESALGSDPAPLATFSGSELAGLRYRPPFAYASSALERAGAVDAAWRVQEAAFVNVEEGTGIVHLAGAFGADDLEAVRRAEIPVFNPVDASGRFDASVPEYAGIYVKDADDDIIGRLRDSGLLLRSETYLHTYPHCWRCGSPLLYYALVSWYIRTTEHRDRLVEANRSVNWVPAHMRDGRYGKWLEGNVDWSLSRFRFWGTPLPLWRCADGHDVAVGSVAQLGELAGKDLTNLDLHRPHVDEIVFPCPECGPEHRKESRRVPDVIDVWYDSGAMPFAQHGYPHREGSAEAFRSRFPADFIAEGLDQIRGWFYSLMAESVLLFDENAYRTVICHGLILDEDGRKMSKSKSVSDPWAVFSRFGSDALRFYYLSSGDPSENRRLSERSLEQVIRGPFLTLWNVYRLYVLYANIDGFDPNSWEPISPHFRPALDRWILSELHQVCFEVEEALNAYDSLRASRRITEFVDDLSNWYVRRSRRRFWRSAAGPEERADKSAAYWTLWTCLSDLSALLAPFAPFLAENLYRNLVSEVNPSAPQSVHLTDFPDGDPSIVDPRLAAGMAAARELASLGRSARSDARVKVRQPLARAVLIAPDDLSDAISDVGDLLADELNVDELAFAEEVGELVRMTLRPNYPTAGPEFGESVRALAEALQALGPEEAESMAATLEEGGEIEIETSGGSLRVSIEHVDIRREPAEGTAFAYEAPFGVSLDLTITPELRREGLAREFVHQVQMLRREIGLDVTDRVGIVVQAPEEIVEALREHNDYVTEELLATGLDERALDPEHTRTIDVDGAEVRVAVDKA